VRKGSDCSLVPIAGPVSGMNGWKLWTCFWVCFNRVRSFASMKAKISRKIMFMAMSKSIDLLSCDSRLYERRSMFLQRKYHNILILSLFYGSNEFVGRKKIVLISKA